MSDFTGIIDSVFKQTFRDAIDSLLESTALTLPCQLIFEDTNVIECPNCYFDSVSGRSSNIYKTAGPIPFTNGVCPYCGGVGTISTDNTSSLSLIVLWNYKDWIGWGNDVKDDTMVPFGKIQTLSKISTISDIKRAKEIIVDTNIIQYVKHKFERISEPNPIGLGSDDYIATMWSRIG